MMALILKISISRNTKCDGLVILPKSGHNYICIRTYTASYVQWDLITLHVTYVEC